MVRQQSVVVEEYNETAEGPPGIPAALVQEPQVVHTKFTKEI
jgi:hypothetical protein